MSLNICRLLFEMHVCVPLGTVSCCTVRIWKFTPTLWENFAISVDNLVHQYTRMSAAEGKLKGRTSRRSKRRFADGVKKPR